MLILNTPLGKRPIIDVKILNGQMWLAADISTYQPMRKWYNQKTLRPLNPPVKAAPPVVPVPALDVAPGVKPESTPGFEVYPRKVFIDMASYYLTCQTARLQALHIMIARTNVLLIGRMSI